MKKLRLYPPDNQVSIRIVPQPIPNSRVLGGDWQWVYSRNAAICTTNPETSEGMLKKSPYQAGAFYDANRVIESVRVANTESRGWVWVLKLRDLTEADFQAWWLLLASPEGPPPELICEDCGAEEGVKMIPAMTAYHVEPGEPDRNAPLLLCPDCREDYVSYWTERWDEYHRGLL